MENLNWGEITTVFFASAIKLGIAGIPTAVFAFGFNFLQAFVVCSAGGIFGTLFYTYLIDAVLLGIAKLMDKIYPTRNKNKKRFTKTNRFIIKVKKNFGIIGVSAISPLFLSIPLGVFLCLKFFGNKKQIIMWMSVFVMFWTILLFFVLDYFRASLENYFT